MFDGFGIDWCRKDVVYDNGCVYGMCDICDCFDVDDFKCWVGYRFKEIYFGVRLNCCVSGV